MTALRLTVLVFGMAPVAALLGVRWIGFVLSILVSRRRRATSRHELDWSSLPGRVPWANLGGSSLARGPVSSERRPEPQFWTLDCRVTPINVARWRLAIQFELRNSTDRELVIEDLHARLFERSAYAPALLDISYYGDVWLKQDNSILKENRSYSLPAGDGYIINLVFEATRIETAPELGYQPVPKAGAATVVFGILLDYHQATLDGLIRRTIPSDAVYAFQQPPADRDAKLLSVTPQDLPLLRAKAPEDKERRKLVTRMEGYLAKHAAFRAERRGIEESA